MCSQSVTDDPIQQENPPCRLKSSAPSPVNHQTNPTNSPSRGHGRGGVHMYTRYYLQEFEVSRYRVRI